METGPVEMGPAETPRNIEDALQQALAISSELLREHDEGESVDLLAAGETIYQLLTGVPYTGAPLSAHMPEAWASLERTMTMCLHEEEALRIDSAELMMDRFRAHLDEWRQGPPPPVVQPSSARHGALRVGVIVGGMALVIAGLIWRHLEGPPPSAPRYGAPMPLSSAPPAITATPEAMRRGDWAIVATHRDPARRAIAKLMLGERDTALLDAELSDRDEALLLALLSGPDMPTVHAAVSKLAEKYDNDAELSFLAAWSASHTKMRGAALRWCKHALALDPGYLAAWKLLAILHIDDADDGAAFGALQRCGDPCWELRRHLQARLGKCDVPLKPIPARRSARIDETSRWVYEIAAHVDSEAEAIEAMRQRPASLNLDRLYDDPRVWAWAGRVYMLAGDNVAAVRALTIATKDCRFSDAPQIYEQAKVWLQAASASSSTSGK